MRYRVGSTSLDIRVFQKENVTERASGIKEPRQNLTCLAWNPYCAFKSNLASSSLLQVQEQSDQISSDKFSSCRGIN